MIFIVHLVSIILDIAESSSFLPKKHASLAKLLLVLSQVPSARRHNLRAARNLIAYNPTPRVQFALLLGQQFRDLLKRHLTYLGHQLVVELLLGTAGDARGSAAATTTNGARSRTAAGAVLMQVLVVQMVKVVIGRGVGARSDQVVFVGLLGGRGDDGGRIVGTGRVGVGRTARVRCVAGQVRGAGQVEGVGRRRRRRLMVIGC